MNRPITLGAALALVLACLACLLAAAVGLVIRACDGDPAIGPLVVSAFLCGVLTAALACGVAFYAFVRRAGADWRRP